MAYVNLDDAVAERARAEKAEARVAELENLIRWCSVCGYSNDLGRGLCRQCLERLGSDSVRTEKTSGSETRLEPVGVDGEDRISPDRVVTVTTTTPARGPEEAGPTLASVRAEAVKRFAEQPTEVQQQALENREVRRHVDAVREGQRPAEPLPPINGVPCPCPTCTPPEKPVCERCGEEDSDERVYGKVDTCQSCYAGLEYRIDQLADIIQRFIDGGRLESFLAHCDNAGIRPKVPRTSEAKGRVCFSCNDPADVVVGAFAYCAGCDARFRVEVQRANEAKPKYDPYIGPLTAQEREDLDQWRCDFGSNHALSEAAEIELADKLDELCTPPPEGPRTNKAAAILSHLEWILANRTWLNTAELIREQLSTVAAAPCTNEAEHHPECSWAPGEDASLCSCAGRGPVYRNGPIPDGAWTECCAEPECDLPGTHVRLTCTKHRSDKAMPKCERWDGCPGTDGSHCKICAAVLRSQRSATPMNRCSRLYVEGRCERESCHSGACVLSAPAGRWIDPNGATLRDDFEAPPEAVAVAKVISEAAEKIDTIARGTSPEAPHTREPSVFTTTKIEPKPVVPGRCGAFTPIVLYCDRPEDHDGDHRFVETFTGNERLVHRREQRPETPSVDKAVESLDRLRADLIKNDCLSWAAWVIQIRDGLKEKP